MKRSANIFLLSLPSLLWLLIFYALPVFIVFLFAFRTSDAYGGIGDKWTLDTVRNLFSPGFSAVIWRTVWLGVVSTALSIVIAVPIAYHLAKMSPKLRNIVLMLIIVPFWTNFLIRIFAWKVFLNPEGILRRTLVLIGLIPEETMLLYNQWAVLAVMVYTYLPYAILPIYAAAEKFDFALLDAAKDLGASSFQGFRKVFLPSISKSIWVAVMVVLIPALGAYLIPDLVGGPTSEMMGDRIAQSVFTERNLPRASALSALLMITVFLPLLLMTALKWIFGKDDEEEESRTMGARS
ncbi:MAG: ABC transporter permease [Lentisphaeria bacterium]|nr:ABC transporter permease [Lentisphaeria bacterium]